MRALRWAVVPLLVVPVAWLFFQGLGRDPREIGSPLIGQPAPPFELVALDGRQVSSEDLRGRPYLVNFWASWCVPACVEEHPVLLEAQERYGDRLAVIGVVYQDTSAAALAFVQRYGDGGWPNLVDPGGRLALEYGVTGPPETYLVDGDGIVRDKHFGPMSAQVMNERVTALLSLEAALR